LPFDFFFSASSGQGYNNLLRLFRLPRLYRLLKISKLFKLIKHYKKSRIIAKFIDYLNIKQSISRLIGVFCSVLICVHIVACL
jgi:hypothetical protein